MKGPKSRFSDRAENYAKYRPGYPRGILKFLEDKRALTNGSVVADIGSGTGNLSELFLENGNRVLAVEPNKEMREAAERLLGDHPGFESVAGAAEDTTLAGESVDLLVVEEMPQEQSSRAFSSPTGAWPSCGTFPERPEYLSSKPTAGSYPGTERITEQGETLKTSTK